MGKTKEIKGFNILPLRLPNTKSTHYIYFKNTKLRIVMPTTDLYLSATYQYQPN